MISEKEVTIKISMINLVNTCLDSLLEKNDIVGLEYARNTLLKAAHTAELYTQKIDEKRRKMIEDYENRTGKVVDEDV